MSGPTHLLATPRFCALAVLFLYVFANQSYSEISNRERQALIALYNSTSGASWTNRSNWLDRVGTECTWRGVRCDASQTTVTQISLTLNQLKGPIPAQLVNLANLQHLSLGSNSLSGPIPAELGNLKNLRSLDLSGNQLSGPIPAQLLNLANLQDLNLGSNSLSGPIHAELGNLANLGTLLLYDNQLSGPIPAELGNLNLTALHLDRNQLSGPIPAELANTRLFSLFLYNNQLSGPIPAELGNLANLRTLFLDENQLSGPIPAELGNLANLGTLRLYDNQLSGPIPAQLGNLKNLRSLILSGNQLSGPIPVELGNLANLVSLYLDSNQLIGPIPVELGNLANLVSLYLNSNQLSGLIPAQLGNLTNLQNLSLYSNQLSGSIPVELGNLANLVSLYLNSNQLSGLIPAQLGNLTNLVSLYLYSNQLSGSIPVELGNLANLVSLYLYSNQLSGPIPTQLGNLTNLQYLSLDNNQLSGPIPAQLGNLTLQSLSLSSNQLSGPIPALRLALRIYLYLAYNALYTNDAALRAFLNARDPNWESTQTIAPGGVTATTQSSSSIRVSWPPIAYSSDPGRYELFCSATPGGPYTNNGGTTADKSTPALLVSSLSPNTTYYFVVRTLTEPHANNQNTVQSGFSSEVSATTAGFPTITRINPTSGPVTGGTPIVITGSEFQTGATVMIGQFVASITSVTPNQIAAITGPAIPGSYNVVVTNPDGRSVTLNGGFTYIEQPPVITSLTPTSKLEADPAFLLAVSGSGFTDKAVVQWNGANRVTKFISPSQLEAAIPTSDILSPGVSPITVVQGSMTSAPVLLRVEPNNQPPLLTGVLPAYISTEGDKIRLLGVNFKPRMLLDGTQFLVAGKPVSELNFVDSTRIDGIAPPNDPGFAPVTLVPVEGKSSSEVLEIKDPVPVPPPKFGFERRVQIPFVIDTDQFRTNLGINNLSDSQISVEVLLVDRNGKLVVPRMAWAVPARGMEQTNHIVRVLLGEPLDKVTGREGYLLLESAGNFNAWASQIDILTEDPSMQQSQGVTMAAGRVLVPSSASIGRFETSLIVINHSDSKGHLNIRSRDTLGGVTTSLTNLDISAHGLLYFENFYQAARTTGVFGPIEVEALGETKVTATARIYTPERTSGYLEGVDPLQSSQSVLLPYSVSTEDFRTNLGITNPGNTPVSVTVSLIGQDGVPLGPSLVESVSPNGMTQIDNIIPKLASGSGGEGYLRLEATGPIIGWTSQIDNQSEDVSMTVGIFGNAPTEVLIPSTASIDRFTSTLVVVNLAPLAATVEIIPRNLQGQGQLAIPAQVFIQSNGFISYKNIRAELGLGGTFGPLEIRSSPPQPLLAVSRVSSPERTGGYFAGVAWSNNVNANQLP